jgi:hypothetical protein
MGWGPGTASHVVLPGLSAGAGVLCTAQSWVTLSGWGFWCSRGRADASLSAELDPVPVAAGERPRLPPTFLQWHFLIRFMAAALRVHSAVPGASGSSSAALLSRWRDSYRARLPQAAAAVWITWCSSSCFGPLPSRRGRERRGLLGHVPGCVVSGRPCRVLLAALAATSAWATSLRDRGAVDGRRRPRSSTALTAALQVWPAVEYGGSPCAGSEPPRRSRGTSGPLLPLDGGLRGPSHWVSSSAHGNYDPFARGASTLAERPWPTRIVGSSGY